MGFMSPDPPKQKPPANAPITANAAEDQLPAPASVSSLISTGPQGLRRKASTQRSSLIGGGS